MKHSTSNDMAALSKLNAQFIKNYVMQDTISHHEIIHRDFVCIQNSGEIMDRDEYMRDWATSYGTSGFTSFHYEDELIRIFGDVALVRSKTVWEKLVDGQTLRGSSIYTDTYIKEHGRWWCVQAQITPIK
ncbi:MAG: nuclear transport factor 2 family protein [Ignavibacteriae bacterium]|nr:nuclear transport factor 2 family protein [Ignavibacteriota bacterium]